MEVVAKHPSIVAHLRRQIVEGEFTPGAQTPTHFELGETFGVSRVTVQKALNRLAQEGFIYAKGRSGTYVSPTPPHLCHYGLILPERSTLNSVPVRFWTALANEADAVPRGEGRRVHCFYGVASNSNNKGETEQLAALVRSHRLAGLIFAVSPDDLLNALPVVQPAMPSVVIAPRSSERYSALDLDGRAFIQKSLDYLRSCGRRQIALLTVPGMPPEILKTFYVSLAERGMESRPYWKQAIEPASAVSASDCVQLLFNPEQRTRPDGLIIADDNLVEHAAAGVIAAGLRVPQDLSIVAHCNFPWPTPSVLPVKRLGYDVRGVLRAAMSIIDCQRRGGTGTSVTKVEPVFEDELART